MAREKLLSFVEARSQLSDILDQAGRGQTIVVAKRKKPVAVILGINRYREIVEAGENIRNAKGRRLLKLRGMACATEDVAKAIGSLRRSRAEGPSGSF